jgi:hypothetical protein
MRTHMTSTGISQASTENHRVVSRDERVAERKTLYSYDHVGPPAPDGTTIVIDRDG